MQEVNSSMVSREGITACLHLPQHDGQQDSLPSTQQWSRCSMWQAAEKEYSYECILWWIKGLIYLGYPRTSDLASPCWFGKVRVFSQMLLQTCQPRRCLGEWWCLQAPLVSPRRTTTCSSLDLSYVGVWSHWAAGERLCHRHRGWYVKKSLHGPRWAHPFLDTLPSSVTPQEARKQGWGAHPPNPEHWVSGAVSLPSVHMALASVMQQPVDLHQ